LTIERIKVFKRNNTISDRILEEIGSLKIEVTSLKAERKAVKSAHDLETEHIKLKRELTDRQIEWDKEKEKWDREKREVEHLVGLQKKRGTFEVESATQKAKLDVREENLAADRKRFDEHVKFIEKRFDQQFESLNGLMEKFLERMPTTKQLITVGSNGSDHE